MINTNSFNLYLIRHAQSIINVDPNIIGQNADCELSSHGKCQAILLKERLNDINFNYIYSSTYRRAVETAYLSIVGLTNKKLILVPELREYSAGSWTGGDRSAILTDLTKLKMGYLNYSFCPPDGESLNEVERRASTWLEQTLLYNNIENKNIVMFSHGNTIRTILHYIMGFERNFSWRIDIANTSVTKLSFDKEGWKLHYLNNYSHLHV
jgi:probable phosphoglycerate mutase